jgi:hypothetical protein
MSFPPKSYAINSKVHNGYRRLCVRLVAVLLYVGFSPSFTTCFGLQGHLQVCRVYIQWVLQCPSACSFIVCWFPLAFTTCFGLHGHLQVCRVCFRLRAALLYVGFHCLSLHVSAYMAIFKCVGCIYNGFCRLCFVGFHRLSLHVSAYMAIFRCIGIFIYLRILLSAFLVRSEAILLSRSSAFRRLRRHLPCDLPHRFK